MKRSRLLVLASTAAAIALVAIAIYLVGGHRYRIYASSHASDCWSKVEAIAPPSAKLRLARVDISDVGPAIDVAIGFRMDRVLARRVLEARCRYPAESLRPSEIIWNGHPIDPASLEVTDAASR